MSQFRKANGKLLLAMGKPLLATPGTAPVSNTTSLTLYDFTVAWPGTQAVKQRKAGTDYLDVRTPFAYTGDAPTDVQDIIVDADTGVVIKDWTTLSGITAANGLGYGMSLSVPIGANYLQHIRLASQPTNQATTSYGTVAWGVGVNVIVCGQSNCVSILSAATYNQIVPGMSLGEYDYANTAAGRKRVSFFSVVGFHAASGGSNGPTGYSHGSSTAAGGTLAIARLLAKGLEAKYGRVVPVCITPWAFNSTGIEVYDPSNVGSEMYKLLHGTGDTSVTFGYLSPARTQPGDYETVLMHQGENNQGGTRLAYKNALNTLHQGHLDFVAPFGRTAANLTFCPSILGVYAVGAGDNIEKIRGAVLDFCAEAPSKGWTKVYPGLNCIDLDPSDGGDSGLHFRDNNQPYQSRAARRWVQTLLKATGCSTVSGAGPYIGTVTRSGLTVTVNIVHEGGTTLVTRAGGAPSGWYAWTDDTLATPVPITAAISGNSTITLTRNDGLSLQGCVIKYMGGVVGTAQSCYPNITNALYDNFSYPTSGTGSDVYIGLPLRPTPDAIPVP